jgi:hypothetical protein
LLSKDCDAGAFFMPRCMPEFMEWICTCFRCAQLSILSREFFNQLEKIAYDEKEIRERFKHIHRKF